MKAGYAQTIITPDLDRPVYLAGFDQNRLATVVHDDLYARAIALSDGDTDLVLCAVDLIGVFQHFVVEVIEQVQKEVPGARVVIAATHTHHGPDTMGLWGPDHKTTGVDPVYIAALRDKVAGTILESLKLDQEVTAVKTCSVQVPGVAKNARDPDILDEELTCLQFTSADGRPMTTFLNFPCHPEVLFDRNTQITSDYPGVLRREIEAVTGVPCIFTAGSLGGMMTPDVDDHSFEEAEAMGAKLASKALDVLAGAESQLGFGIKFRNKRFAVKLTNLLFKIAIRRGLLPEPRDERGVVITQANLIQIGDCWLVTVPGELFPKLGLQIKALLVNAGARVPGVIGLGNDELGYILPEDDFRYPLNPFNPRDHYEETMSISKQIGPKLMEAITALLNH